MTAVSKRGKEAPLDAVGAASRSVIVSPPARCRCKTCTLFEASMLSSSVLGREAYLQMVVCARLLTRRCM